MSRLTHIALIGASALSIGAATAVTADAQPWRHYDGYNHDSYNRAHDRGYTVGRYTTSYVDSLDWRITAAARNGAIPWGEARDLRAQLRSVQPLAYRVETGSASNGEFRRLDRVVSRIEAATSRYASTDHPRRPWR